VVDQLAELRDQRGEPARAGRDFEEVDDQRVAGLGAAHRDRSGGAVDPREVDLRDEVGLGPDLAGEAVIRLEADDGAGLDLEHRLQLWAEAPDDLVAGDDVVYGSDGHVSGFVPTRGSCLH